MTKAKLGIGVLFLVALCVTGVWVLAGFGDERPSSDSVRSDAQADRDDARRDDRPRDVDRPRDEDQPRDVDRPRADAVTDDEAPPVRDLGKTIKLNFTIVGEDEEPSFFVLCAARDFLINHDVSEPDFEHFLNIVGRIHPTDAKDRVFITFEAMRHHTDQNEGIEASFRAEGSAILKVGDKVKLAVLGEEPLTVTATVED